MKTIIGILLVGLLGFLGCSGSDDGTSAVVGEAIPVAPFGIIDTFTPTYEWTPVPGATRYRLVVQDTNQASTNQDTSETAVIDEWFTTGEAGCASEDGPCMATSDIKVFEENTWKVQACANQDCGMWSDILTFSKPTGMMALPRFIDNGDETVTDTKTSLMWSKDARITPGTNWEGADRYCSLLELAGLSDWYLPSLSQLATLIDIHQRHPSLPLGHPFTGEIGAYWTSTSHVTEPDAAWYVYMYDGTMSYQWKGRPLNVWPVREDIDEAGVN